MDNYILAFTCPWTSRKFYYFHTPAQSHTFVEIDYEIFLRSFPPYHRIIQEGLLSVTSQSMCTNYGFTACPSLSRKKCGSPAMTIAVDLGRKATKQTNKQIVTLRIFWWYKPHNRCTSLGLQEYVNPTLGSSVAQW